MARGNVRVRRARWMVRLSIVLLAACSGRSIGPSGSAASSPTESPRPSVSIDLTGSWIVFHSDPGGDSRLSLMRPDGSHLTLLTDTVAGHPFGVWSPDGSRIAFLSGSFGEGTIFVIDADGSGERQVSDMQAYPPAWSPDGERLVFGAVDGGIYSIGADGSDLTKLTDAGSGPSWSPDGSRIVFFAEEAGNVDVYVMGTDGREPLRLTHDPADDVSPAWSPDGRTIAFVSDRSGRSDIYVIDPDGSREQPLTHDPAPDEAFDWSPDGRRIVYVSYLEGADPQSIGIGNAEVFVVDVRSGHPRNLTRNDAWDGDPAWSPDGTRIVFTRRTDHAEIYVMRPDGSGQRMLPGFPGDAVNDCCARWRP